MCKKRNISFNQWKLAYLSMPPDVQAKFRADLKKNTIESKEFYSNQKHQ